MDDWLPFIGLGIAFWALVYAGRSYGAARIAAGRNDEMISPAKVVAYRGLSHDGRRHIVVIELEATAIAARPALLAALMSAPPDGPAAPDHTVPLWHRNGGYEA